MISFRKANSSDLPAAMTIVRGAVRHMEQQGIFQWGDTYPSVADLERDIEEGTMYLGCAQDQVIAMATLDRCQPPEYATVEWSWSGTVAVMHRLAVHPDEQGRGVARQFLDHLESVAWEAGFRAIRLDSFMDNPRACRLYEARGYRRAGAVEFRERRFVCFEKGSERE